ncbi:MAG: PDZ domain-containing protein [Planctomycetes bacterium]|nr:PDZ domain-containing protein [Planctomycetota bacterium]
MKPRTFLVLSIVGSFLWAFADGAGSSPVPFHPLWPQDQDQEESEPEKAEKQEASEPEALEFTVKVGKRPPAPYEVPGFKARDPLTLEGRYAEAETLRAALAKGLTYVLEQQEEDGSWKFVTRGDKSQLRKDGDAKKSKGFVPTARDSTNPVIMTSLACMALRAHQEFAPVRIGAAVERGLAYLLKGVPTRYLKKTNYGIWTWCFTLQFLVQEYRRCPNAERKAQIREVAQQLADKVLQNQHKGEAKLRKTSVEEKPPQLRKPDSDLDQKRGETSRRSDQKLPSKGGYFGITPSDNDEVGKEGVLVYRVDRKSPAAKAGVKRWDRIVQIGDVKIESVEHLYEVIDSLKPRSEIVIKVLREESPSKPKNTQQMKKAWFEQDEKKEEQGQDEKKKEQSDDEKKQDQDEEKDKKKKKRQPRQPRLPADGGWSYYQMGAVSFGTATCVLALCEAADIGLQVPEDAILRGAQFVDASRIHKRNSDEYGYAYQANARSGVIADVRGSIGRLAVCEMALFRVGRRTQDDVAWALDIFGRRRGELDRVRGYPSNHYGGAYMNAAYYHLYAHYYSALACNTLNYLKEVKQARHVATLIQEALLKLQHAEGTWTDHEAWGQLSGTSMALMALGEIKWMCPGAYTGVIPSLESRVLEDF